MEQRQGDEPRSRKLKVDLAELIFAFESGSEFGEMYHYLDLETGEIVLVTDETSSILDQIYEEASKDMGEDELANLLAQRNLPDWEQQDVLRAGLVEAGLGDRFIRVPQIETHEAYRDMADFIDTVEESTLRRLLEVAIDGRGAFRRFKTVLYDFPEERERWFAFKDARLKQRVLDWLASEGIEPVVE